MPERQLTRKQGLLYVIEEMIILTFALKVIDFIHRDPLIHIRRGFVHHTLVAGTVFEPRGVASEGGLLCNLGVVCRLT